MTLIRVSGIPRMNFLLRTTPQAITHQSAIVFDTMIESAIKAVLKVPSLSEDSLAILKLPFRLGGFGLRSQTMLQQFAYDCLEVNSQQEATKAKEKEHFDELTLRMKTKGSNDVLATILSQRDSLSSAWLKEWKELVKNILQDKTVMSNDASVFALRRRALVLDEIKHGHCLCDKKISSCEHIYHCQKFDKHGAHDAVTKSVVDKWRILGVAADATTKTYRRSNGARSSEKPDGVAQVHGDIVAFDTTVVCPSARDYLKLASSLEINFLSASEAAEKSKVRDGTAMCAQQGHHFQPIAIETTGRIGPSTSTFLLNSFGIESTKEAKSVLRQLVAQMQYAMFEQHAVLARKLLGCYRPLDGAEGRAFGVMDLETTN
jgi:hypothetical protein